MPLPKGRLPESLAKWNLKSPTKVFRLPKSESPPRSPKSVMSFQDVVDSDDEAGPDGLFSYLPKGYLAVYVGEEARRFIIPVSYLSHPIFKALLKMAEEEFGFSISGGIRLPCETLLFEHILWLLRNNDPMIQNLEMVEELLSFYHEETKCNC
ncbi:auxin-responsive protein SAUR41-like [Nymphaea colorata]|uniref:auxin-responsive protein SAUR41-like n=1 Tax=Nymphaea colorata TaxID=210225 RepID=UPI00129D4916|nr:auxin-responsive protein SAUR41-like [Nymphaea colorata]